MLLHGPLISSAYQYQGEFRSGFPVEKLNSPKTIQKMNYRLIAFWISSSAFIYIVWCGWNVASFPE